MVFELTRSVLSFGKQSLGIVIPKLWAKSKNLKAGDSLTCFITDKAVIYAKHEDAESLRKAFNLEV